MENQRLSVADGVIFYVTWSMVEYDSIEEALMYFIIPFYSHPETHKDPVGTTLHIQEANMNETTQKKTHRTRSSRLHDYRETSEEQEVSRDTSAFIPNVEDHMTFL
ncbi:hypothetical protein TNCV_4925521 [Trichonephila clavipes]|nr:hypothetical protein TNCV_4925521 [Trichonephila clavipes]